MKRTILLALLIAFAALLAVGTYAEENTAPVPIPQNMAIFVIDVSGSMDWATYPSPLEMEQLPEELKEELENYRTSLSNLANDLNDEEKNQFFAGCGSCSVDLLDETKKDIPDLSRENPNYEFSRTVESMRNDLEKSGKEYRVSKLSSAKKAALNLINMMELAEQVFGTDAHAGVISFSGSGSERSKLTYDLNAVRGRIDALKAYGGTNIGSGLEEAFETRKEGALPSSKVNIVLLSDGRVNAGRDPEAILEIYSKNAGKENVKIDTIGFGMIEAEVDKALLQELAESTGGSYNFAATSNELSLSFILSGHTGLGNSIIFKALGSILQGEEKVIGTLQIGYDTGELLITLNWPGSELDLKLRDGAGNIVPESEYTLVKNENMVMIKMNEPHPGNYELVAFGKDVPEGELEYNVIVSEEKGKFKITEFLIDNILIIVVGVAVAAGAAFYLIKKKSAKSPAKAKPTTQG